MISIINSKPELLNLMRQEDDEEEKTDNELDEIYYIEILDT